MAMTTYQKTRVKTGQVFIQKYKATFPCIDCGTMGPDIVMFFVKKGDTTPYGRSIAAVVGSGAGQTRLMKAVSSRDMVCAGCFAKRQSTSGLARFTPPSVGGYQHPSQPKSAKTCPPFADSYIALWLTKNAIVGPCDGIHRFGVCNPILTDTIDGHILSSDEGKKRFLSDMKPLELDVF